MSTPAPLGHELLQDRPAPAPLPERTSGHPLELARMLSGDLASREAAWSSFATQWSKLILHVARSLGADHDAILDRYVYVMDHLRKNDFRRLRAYRPDGRSRFSTWLVVVARRLCLDHHREMYGRKRTAKEENGRAEAARPARHRIIDLMVESVDPDHLRCEHEGPEEDARRAELEAGLAGALERLEAPSRLLLSLRFDDALSAAEIARIVKLPTPFHVYRRLNGILAGLRTDLVSAGFEDPRP